ncbi:hypothetical protein OROMI_017283 [Orobanche minor]
MAAMLRSAGAASASFSLADHSNKLSTFSICSVPVIRSERSSIPVPIFVTRMTGKLITKAVAAQAENSVSAASKPG